MIIDNIAEYMVRAVPQLCLKDFTKFLIEGLLSGHDDTQKQICYSIYSNFSPRLHLLQLYECFDDSLCQIVIEDLISVYQALNLKAGMSNARRYSVVEESPRLPKAYNMSPSMDASPGHRKKRRSTFLIADPLEPSYTMQHGDSALSLIHISEPTRPY
eukprot:TRINITY_DN11918_c0_g2_i8.p1 TRINITY_DN11918_c0_g2~~TRINITY_DN11918_c0_g2_i8.p1  ORF type:complete len:158 (-),score=51.11 TRINITY_DN11918_c0_g2_i8:48-521(-)